MGGCNSSKSNSVAESKGYFISEDQEGDIPTDYDNFNFIVKSEGPKGGELAQDDESKLHIDQRMEENEYLRDLIERAEKDIIDLQPRASTYDEDDGGEASSSKERNLMDHPFPKSFLEYPGFANGEQVCEQPVDMNLKDFDHFMGRLSKIAAAFDGIRIESRGQVVVDMPNLALDVS